MKYLILFILLVPYFSFSQEIKWNTVPYNAIDPDELLAKGVIELDNGELTPEADLSIDFANQTIFYRNLLNNAIFSVFKEDFAKISVSDYKNGLEVKDSEFYGDVGEEIGAALRKGLYDKADLNVLNITSVEKEGFFRRSQPKFYMNDGELDVSNKSIVIAKVLEITPNSISYLDNEGDLWLRGNSGAKNVTAGEGGDKKEEREEKREARKQARILNIEFGGKFFLNVRELYNYAYNSYEENFYKSLENFKNDFIGINLRKTLSEWGPVDEQIKLNTNTTLYTWHYERKVIESESTTVTAGSAISQLTRSSRTSASAVLSSKYGINTNASKYSLGGYGSIINSYTQINGSSFLNYYSRNITNQYSSYTSYSVGQTSSTSIQVDDTKKIGLIVDSDLNIVDVIAQNFFPVPYYGVSITFVDEN